MYSATMLSMLSYTDTLLMKYISTTKSFNIGAKIMYGS